MFPRIPCAPGLATLAMLGALLGACGDDDGSAASDAGPPPDAAADAAIAPAFRNPVDLADEELAIAALALLGAPVAGAIESCNDCHGMTRQNVRHWRALGDFALGGCLADLEVSDPAAARAMIDCLRSDPAVPTSQFRATKLGIYTTAAHLDWFVYLFRLGMGDDSDADHAAFVSRVGMPRGGHPRFAQADFDIVAEYFARGLPLLDAVMPDDPPPQECTPGVSADVGDHVSQMATAGWAAANLDAALLMHGCGGASDPRDCLAGETREAGWEVPGGAVIRSLRDVDYQTSFWTRSSADGRFVGHGVSSGLGANAAFVDLQTDTVIPAAAFYDPGFFPDNSGFAFQDDNAHFCSMSVLTAEPASVTFDEASCTVNGQVGLYQHLGASVDGGDYWTVHGQFVSDDGGHEPTRANPVAYFSSDARIRLTPMINQGDGFEPGATESVLAPFEGDMVISPSARLLVGRVAGPGEEQIGYVLRRIDATVVADGYDIETPEIARYCVTGGKPGFSFDERWMAYHHYVEASDAVALGFIGPDDPAFAPYLTEGAANLYLLDLLDGSVRRISDVAPGEYALFPHFRSDGWIYFQVRRNGGTETIAATDAALVAAE